jgi:hypothetical protein
MEASAAGLVAIIGAVVLGLVLAYASLRNRSRSRKNDQIGQAATREEYRHPESYNPQKFRDGLENNPDGSIPRKE